MTPFPKPKVQTLSEWLEIATRKLAEPSQERILAEIEAHYTEAVEVHRENGRSDAEAETAALAELGDPNAARRRFRKNHLTEGDEQYLKNLDKTGRSIVMLAANYLLFVSFVFDQLQRNALDRYHNVPLGLSLEFLVTIALPTTSFVIARRSKGKSNRNLLLLMLFLPGYGFVPGILLDSLLRGIVFHFAHWLWSIGFLLQLLAGLRIWRKLGQSGMIPNYAPPPNTAEASS